MLREERVPSGSSPFCKVSPLDYVGDWITDWSGSGLHYPILRVTGVATVSVMSDFAASKIVELLPIGGPAQVTVRALSAISGDVSGIGR
jgi:hypothetical protein